MSVVVLVVEALVAVVSSTKRAGSGSAVRARSSAPPAGRT
jgi:hypothetical protein